MLYQLINLALDFFDMFMVIILDLGNTSKEALLTLRINKCLSVFFFLISLLLLLSQCVFGCLLQCGVLMHLLFLAISFISLFCLQMRFCQMLNGAG